MRIIEGTKVVVHTGDITEMEADSIVNAANSHLWMGSGVAGAIRRKGGIVIEREAVDKGPIAIGDAVTTEAGNLRARHVIHAALMGPDLLTDPEKIRKATVSALEKARETAARMVAFPAFGTGVAGFPVDQCAEIMVRTVFQYLKEHPGAFAEISFVLLDSSAAQIFENVVDEPGN